MSDAVEKVIIKHRNNMSGTTLFEVLLYIALFSVIFTIAGLSYFSIVRHIDRLQIVRQRTEVHFMIYELLRFNYDSRGVDKYIPAASDFRRVLKFYPALIVSEIKSEVVRDRRFNVDVANVEYIINGRPEHIQIYLPE